MPAKGEKLGEIFVEVKADIEQLKKDFAKIKKRSENEGRKAGNKFGQKFSKSMKSQVAKIGGIIAGMFAFEAIIRVGRHFVELGSKIKDLRNAYENLSAEQGLNADIMLGKMQKATKGTVNDLDLLQQANNALLLGLPVTEKDMETLAEAGLKLGKAMGIDAAKGMESLVVGIGRQSKLWLDNLGIIVDTELAYQRYATSLNKTAEQLTDSERKLAFYNATMTQVKEKVDKIGPAQLTFADTFKEIKIWAEKAGIAVVEFLDKALIPKIEKQSAALDVLKKEKNLIEYIQDRLLSGLTIKEIENKIGIEQLNALKASLGIRELTLKNLRNAVAETERLLRLEQERVDNENKRNEISKVLTTRPGKLSGKARTQTRAQKQYENLISQEPEYFGLIDLQETSEETKEILSDTWDSMRQEVESYIEYVNLAQDAMSTGFMQMFDDLIQIQAKTNNVLERGFVAMANAFIQQVERMVAQWLAFKAVMGLVNLFAPGAGTIGGTAATEFIDTPLNTGLEVPGGGFTSTGITSNNFNSVVGRLDAINANLVDNAGANINIGVQGQIKGRDIELTYDKSKKITDRIR